MAWREKKKEKKIIPPRRTVLSGPAKEVTDLTLAGAFLRLLQIYIGDTFNLII